MTPSTFNGADKAEWEDDRSTKEISDPNFVEAVVVQTEYERGWKEGVASREGLAVEVMNYTAEIEQANIRLAREKNRISFYYTLTTIWAVSATIAAIHYFTKQF